MSQGGSGNGVLEQQVRGRIETLAYLPTTAAVAMKFVELGKNPEADPADYAKVISSDASLSTKLLALANSSWFGVRNRVTKPNVAVNLLGLGTVRTLAISYCLTGLHNDLKLAADESRMFWSAALCKAVAAKQLARHFDPKLAEEAFAAGLFQDFAQTVMYATAKDQVLPLVNDPEIDCKARLEKERDLFHLDHAEIGRMVAQKLELPDLFVDAVAFHHNHASLCEFLESRPIADAVYASALFPHALNTWNRADAEELRAFVAECTKSKPLDVNAYLQAVQDEFLQLYAYFENGQAPEMNLGEMLAAATREAADNTTRLMGTVHELLNHAAQAGSEVHQLIKQQRKLEEAALRDPLTGALNRDGFNTRAKEALSKASRYGMNFGLVYLDLDQFKQLNDSLGHHYGDTGLRRLVALAGDVLKPADLIARLGGDEFALLVCDGSEEDTTKLVQTIISRLAAEPLNKGENPKRITASAGLLWSTGKLAHPLDVLLAASDKLMYAAKRAGGNRIQIGRLAAPAAATAAA